MKLFDLSGKAALVTGGNGGIGLGMAQGRVQAGARVAIAGRDSAKNQKALTSLGDAAVALVADVCDERACRAMVDEAASRSGASTSSSTTPASTSANSRTSTRSRNGSAS